MLHAISSQMIDGRWLSILLDLDLADSWGLVKNSGTSINNLRS